MIGMISFLVNSLKSSLDTYPVSMPMLTTHSYTYHSKLVMTSMKSLLLLPWKRVSWTYINGCYLIDSSLTWTKLSSCLLVPSDSWKKVNITTLRLGDTTITQSPSAVKNLGAWFDAQLNMHEHIKKTCSSSFFHIYNIRRIRKYLSRKTTESLVHAFVSSKLDFCNSLLYGLPDVHIAKLQRVQNAAARLVVGLPRFCHITPVLCDLHWLPIRYRINFKILLLTFKCLHGLAPKYLSDLLTVSKPSRYNLRNHMGTLLTPASVKFKVTLGDRAFKSSAPKLWNSLPLSIRNIQSLNKFKAQIKTYLFKLAFN